MLLATAKVAPAAPPCAAATPAAAATLATAALAADTPANTANTVTTTFYPELLKKKKRTKGPRKGMANLHSQKEKYYGYVDRGYVWLEKEEVVKDLVVSGKHWWIGISLHQGKVLRGTLLTQADLEYFPQRNFHMLTQ